MNIERQMYFYRCTCERVLLKWVAELPIETQGMVTPEIFVDLTNRLAGELFGAYSKGYFDKEKETQHDLSNTGPRGS